MPRALLATVHGSGKVVIDFVPVSLILEMRAMVTRSVNNIHSVWGFCLYSQLDSHQLLCWPWSAAPQPSALLLLGN